MKLLLSGLVSGYLIGSISFAWIAVRWLKGIDMRNYGTRTVSASMVGVLVSKFAAVMVGCLDVLKALLLIYLAQKFQLGDAFTYGAGIGALLGHNWPVWLKFQGGRGVSVILGSLAMIFPPGAVYILLMLGLGKLLKAGAILVIIALATMPVLATLFREPLPVRLFCIVTFIICLIKRIEANREPLPATNRAAVIIRRIFLDRDHPDYHTWLGRQPATTEPDNPHIS